MFHVENPLTVKGLTFTREETDKAVDGSMFTSYAVTRDSHYDFDPQIATVVLYSDGETVLILDGSAPSTDANVRARRNLRSAVLSSGLTLSPLSSRNYWA